MNLLLRDQRGQSLIQVLIAVGIMGILMVTMTSLFEIFHKQQNQNNLVFQAGMLRNNLVSALNNPVAWKNTTTQSANDFAGGTMLDCLNNGKPCTTDQSSDLTSGGTPVEGALIRRVLDSSGMVILDSSNPNSGYTPQGSLCSTFNGALGAGDDSCPLRYEVRWWAKCNSVTNTCVNAQPELQVVAIYNPRKQSHAFNPANYGTPKFLQGQDPGGLCWQLVGTSLFETCATGVGIGTATPEQLLHLSSANKTGTGLELSNTDTGGKSYGLISSGSVSPGGAGQLQVYDYSASKAMMTFDAAGNVGIGTSIPGQKLDVNGVARIRSNVELSTPGSAIGFNRNFAAGGASYDGSDYNWAIAQEPTTRGLSFNSYFVDGSLAATNLFINPAGYVGIGTTKPVAQFEVAASTGGYAMMTDASPSGSPRSLLLQSPTSSRDYSTIRSFMNGVGAKPLILQDLGGNVGIGTSAPSQKLQVNGNVAAQGFFHTSDKREKTNIVPLGKFESVLARLDSIHGVYFDWKKSGEKSIGVLAQDVVRDFPELVDRRDDRHWTVNYGGLTAVALEAVKELREQNQSLKAELSSLRAEVDSLLRASAKAKKDQR